MDNLRTIKILMKLKGLTSQEKRHYIKIGLIENLLNSYKSILKLPILLIYFLFVIIRIIAEKIEELFDFILYKIDSLKTFNLCKKEEIERLKKIIKEENTRKVEIKDSEKVNIGDYENAKAFAEKQRI